MTDYAQTQSGSQGPVEIMIDKDPVWFCPGDCPSGSIFPLCVCVGGGSNCFTVAFKALKDLSPASVTIEAGLPSLSHIPPLLFWRCVDLPA